MDTSGNRIANMCGNMLQEGQTFYWYGWDFSTRTVNCYTSTTLASDSWTKVTTGGFPMFGSGWHGRPDVIKHPNGTYVMIAEVQPTLGRNGIEYLTSPSPTGPFTRVLQEDFVLGHFTMGDKGIYQDDDAARTAYLLCTADDGETNSTTKIIKLNPDYVGQHSVIQSWTFSPKREALSLFKRNGTYYLTASRTVGWKSSQTPYKTSNSMEGKWTEWSAVPTNPPSKDSFDTQHDFIVKIAGTQTTSYFYMGDRWGRQRTKDKANYSNNVWLPLTFDAKGVPTIQGVMSWSIDPVTGIITMPPNP